MSVTISQRENGSWRCWYYDGDGKRKVVTLKLDGRNPQNRREAEQAQKQMLPDLLALDTLRTHEKAVMELATTRHLIASIEHKPQEIWGIFEKSHKDTSARRLYQIKLVIDRFLTYCDKNEITTTDKITKDAIEKWLEEISTGCASRTYNGHLADLRMVLNASYREIGMDANPTERIKPRARETVSRQPYTLEAIETMLKQIDKGLQLPYRYKVPSKQGMVERLVYRPYTLQYKDEVKTAIMLGAYCGMRLVDAVSLRYEQYNNGFITYKPSKTSKTSKIDVVVPVVNAELRMALENGKGLITPQLKAMHDKSDSMCSRIFRHVFEACGFEIKAEGKGERKASVGGFHALRHSFVTICAEAGVPIEVLSSCVGHTTPMMTQTYLHINQRKKAEELAKIMTFAK